MQSACRAVLPSSRALLAALVVAVPFSVHASVIGRNAFGPGATVEGFEAFGNTRTLLTIPYEFASGAKLVRPNPNYGIDFGVYGIGTATFFGAAPAPDGIAYLAQANLGLFSGPIVFDFPAPELRVGGLIATETPGSGASQVTMSVYSTSGAMLESVPVMGILPQQWANDFVGIERPEGIGSVSFTGDTSGVFRLDDLTFEALPEPASGSMLVLLAPLLLRRRHAPHPRLLRIRDALAARRARTHQCSCVGAGCSRAKPGLRRHSAQADPSFR